MRHQPTLLEQTVEHFCWDRFDRLVRQHGADDAQRGFTSRHHFLALLAEALGSYGSLRKLIAALAPNSGALRLLGGKAPARSTLSDAMRDRPDALFFDLLQALLGYAHAPKTRQALREAVRLIDATHLGLGARMERWFDLHKGTVAAKLHVVYDPAAQRPTYFALTKARINDITAAKCLLPIEPGATYVFDMGYYNFAWWARLVERGCTFVTRLKSNTSLRATERREVTPGGTVIADQLGYLPERLASQRHNPFDQTGREVTIRIDNGKILRLFTNDLTSPAEEIAALYKERWQIELFFKWVKQNLRINKFLATSENAIRVQIAVSFIAYILVRMVQTAQDKSHAASNVLAIIRAHLFVRRPIAEMLDPRRPPPPKCNQPAAQMVLPVSN